MRCVFEYGPGAGGSVDAEGGGGVPAPEAAPAAGSVSIRRVFVVREGLDRLPPEDADKEVKSKRGGSKAEQWNFGGTGVLVDVHAGRSR